MTTGGQETHIRGRTIVVTGAGQGIGRDIAIHCAASGASTALLGRGEERLRDTERRIRAAHPQAKVLVAPADISDEAQVRHALDRTEDELGPIAGLVANAGVIGAITPALNTRLEDWRALVDVNLTGTFVSVIEAARRMVRTQTKGSIVIIGSSTAVRTIPGFLSYVASKGGVHAMAKALALELAEHHIRVNTIAPGTTATEGVNALPGYAERIRQILPMGELVEAGEIARLAAFLLGDQMPHMTGALLSVDSGRTIG